jgi:transposase
LRLLTAHRHRLTVEVTRLKNRLRGLLDIAWPELLERFTSLDKATPLAVLERWPLPQDFAAAGLRRVRHEIKAASRNHIDADRVRELFDVTRQTIGLPDAADERRIEIEFLLARWRLSREQIGELDARIAGLVEICPEAKALTTVPEVSAVCAATIVSELGTPSDYDHHRQVLKLAGMNLVSKSSGLRGPNVTPKWQSKRGRPMLRRQLFLLAGRWCQTRGLYHEDYQALLARNGGLRTQAVCSLARKLVPMLLAVMKTQQPFDLDLWLANRHRPEAA